MAYLQLPLVGTPGPPGPAGGGLAAVEDDPTPRLGGNLDANSNSITSVGTVNGVTVEGHAARHLGGGADAIAVATGINAGLMSTTDFTKLAGIASGATNTPLTAATPVTLTAASGTVGVATDAARADHRHQVSAGSVVAIGSSNSDGAATSFSRSDHVHAHGAQTDGSMHAIATQVVAGFLSAADKTKIDNLVGTSLSNATPELSLATTGAAGASTDASRGDHRHQVTTAIAVDIGTANAIGTSASLARADHVHNHGNLAGGSLHAVAVAAVSDGFISAADQMKLDGVASGATNTPLSSTAGAAVNANAGIVGVGTTAARDDHTHQVAAGSPTNIGTANADGIATNFARADHVHNHGNLAGGSLHADAIASGASGFMSGSDKAKLDSVSGNLPTTFVSIIDDFVLGYNGGTWEVGNYGWHRRSNGTGNVGTSIDGDADHPGIYQMGCGTTGTSLSCIYLAGVSSAYLPFQIGGGEIVITWVVQQNGTLANMARSLFGLGDIFQANADQSNGVYFEVDSGDTNWHLVSNNGGTKTRRDTAIAYTDGNWMQLRFTINAGATSIQAEINGTNAGSAITTNIPTAAKLGLVAKTDGNSGVSNLCNVDFCQMTIERTNNRYD
jgi:hypothetical protein